LCTKISDRLSAKSRYAKTNNRVAAGDSGIDQYEHEADRCNFQSTVVHLLIHVDPAKRFSLFDSNLKKYQVFGKFEKTPFRIKFSGSNAPIPSFVRFFVREDGWMEKCLF
jgi:hypothetical protein